MAQRSRLWAPDEFYAHFETAEGYTVVYDQVSGAYCFAELAPDGQLISSGQQVHLAQPARLGLAKHLRMSKEARRKQVALRSQRWEAEMQVRKAWEERKAVLRQYETGSEQAVRSPRHRRSPPQG